MSKIEIKTTGYKILSEVEAEEMRHALAEYDEAQKKPKRFVPEKGAGYTFIYTDGSIVTVEKGRLQADTSLIAMGNSFPPDSGLAEKAAPMIAECIKAIHCALRCDVDAELVQRFPINIKSPNEKASEMREMYDHWDDES